MFAEKSRFSRRKATAENFSVDVAIRPRRTFDRFAEIESKIRRDAFRRPTDERGFTSSAERLRGLQARQNASLKKLARCFLFLSLISGSRVQNNMIRTPTSTQFVVLTLPIRVLSFCFRKLKIFLNVLTALNAFNYFHAPFVFIFLMKV